MSRKIKTEDGESIFQKVVNEFNSGITDYKEIAKKLKIAKSTSATYLSRAKKLGLLNEKNNTFKKVINLFNSGVKEPKKIASLLGRKENTVKDYLNNAMNQGLIERNLSLYEKFIEVYNSGTTRHKDLADILNLSMSTIKKYTIQAKKEGKIHKISTYDKVLKKYNSGITDFDQIAVELDIKKSLVYRYIEKGRKEGKLNNSKLGEKKEVRVDSKYIHLREHIKSRYEKGAYPRDIAKQLGISSKIVYDYLDSLDKKDLDKMKFVRASKNPLFLKFKQAILDENVDQKEFLKNLKMTLTDPKELIYLARLYYIYGNFSESEKVLDNLIKAKNKNLEIIQIAFNEKEKIHLEYLSLKIRHEYKNGTNIDSSQKTYSDLCREFNVLNKFVVDVLGPEKREIEI